MLYQVMVILYSSKEESTMTVTFCGHSQVADPATVADRLTAIIEELIAEGADDFLLGGYGEFDGMAARAVRNAKVIHPQIRSELVIPYIDRDFDPALYDGSVYPSLEIVPRRYAISKRNEWMVDNSDVVVACVTHGWGGAATTLKYAQRKKKRIISIDGNYSIE